MVTASTQGVRGRADQKRDSIQILGKRTSIEEMRAEGGIVLWEKQRKPGRVRKEEKKRGKSGQRSGNEGGI